MPQGVPLTKIKPYEKVRIISLPTNERNLRKLTSFGILPGIEVEVLQISPTYVLRIQYTQLALDLQIAQNIIVEKIKRQDT